MDFAQAILLKHVRSGINEEDDPILSWSIIVLIIIVLILFLVLSFTIFPAAHSEIANHDLSQLRVEKFRCPPRNEPVMHHKISDSFEKSIPDTPIVETCWKMRSEMTANPQPSPKTAFFEYFQEVYIHSLTVRSRFVIENYSSKRLFQQLQFYRSFEVWVPVDARVQSIDKVSTVVRLLASLSTVAVPVEAKRTRRR